MLELKPAAWPAGGKGKGARLRVNLLQARLQRPRGHRPADRHPARTGLHRLRRDACRRARTELKPTTILLTRSLEEYAELVKARGHNILNPAFYDPRENQVVCGSDLERLGEELDKVQAQHAKLLEELKDRRKELTRIYKGQAPAELLVPVDEALRKHQARWRRRTTTSSRLCHLAWCGGCATRRSTPT